MKDNKNSTIDLKIKYKKDIKDIKKNKPWYTTNLFSVIALILLACIDFSGFLQGGLSLVGELDESTVFDALTTYISMAVMLTGFTAAFEGATIYMAYAFSIKLYNYDKSALIKSKSSDNYGIFSKFVSTSSLGWISFFSFVLGVIANTIFRIGLYYYKTCDSENISCSDLSKEKTLMIVMIILPIITSILNFVISCFSFDPLLFELNKLGKRIAYLNSQNEMIKNNAVMVDTLINEITTIKENEKIFLAKEKTRIATLRPVLRSKMYEYAKKGKLK